MNARGVRMGWLTDVHRDFFSPPGRPAFYQHVVGERLDAILPGGNTGEVRRAGASGRAVFRAEFDL
jgi:hypothetical protein